jgi:hypothetical protein
MATEIHIRKLEKSWQYDFKLPDKKRVRQGGFRTRQAALTAGQKHLAKMESGAEEITLSDAYKDYMAATRLKDRARDTYEHHWKRIEPLLGHYLIDEITTSALDVFKQNLPAHLGPRTVNHHLILVRAILGFMWKRGKLVSVPYIPRESVPQKHQDWYTQEERDRLLDGMFRMYPQWYLFFTVKSGIFHRSSLWTGRCNVERRPEQPNSRHERTTSPLPWKSRRMCSMRSTGILGVDMPAKSFCFPRVGNCRDTSTAICALW